MKLHRVLNGLLILLLLLAQQAAYAHAITHLAKEPPAKEQLETMMSLLDRHYYLK